MPPPRPKLDLLRHVIFSGDHLHLLPALLPALDLASAPGSPPAAKLREALQGFTADPRLLRPPPPPRGLSDEVEAIRADVESRLNGSNLQRAHGIGGDVGGVGIGGGSGVAVVAFGSAVVHCGRPRDVDLCILTGTCVAYTAAAPALNHVAEALARPPPAQALAPARVLDHFRVVENARVPVLTCTAKLLSSPEGTMLSHASAGGTAAGTSSGNSDGTAGSDEALPVVVGVDMVANNLAALLNSALQRRSFAICPRLRCLAAMVRSWIHGRGLCGEPRKWNSKRACLWVHVPSRTAPACALWRR